ncbi:MAG: rhodanese-like domain-containing protein [Desulfarculaceae bacterium]|nr:rhodanese-like domain-containing protein [Desulfarculaceae bacterium]
MAVVLAALLLAALPALAAAPAWWAQAKAQADQYGYGLIDDAGLDKLLASDKDFLLLDVRPDYEYAQGHIKGAKNLEFHLGDRLTLDPAKAKRFEALAGPDRGRLLVIYCRSFR